MRDIHDRARKLAAHARYDTYEGRIGEKLLREMIENYPELEVYLPTERVPALVVHEHRWPGFNEDACEEAQDDGARRDRPPPPRRSRGRGRPIGPEDPDFWPNGMPKRGRPPRTGQTQDRG